jgi:predicted amidohydrolase
MRIAAIQMTSTADKARNLQMAHDLMAAAKDRGAELVAFPENFAMLTDDSREFVDGAETLKGMIVETLCEWAAEQDLWILGGSVALKSASKASDGHKTKRGVKPGASITNTSLLINSDGEIVARYDKIHLFDVELSGDRRYHESEHIRAGRKPVVADTPWGRVGLSVCYDLRFPELYRKLSRDGAEVIFAPSAFTAVTGKAHWDTLTRARAIENQAFVVAPAQAGRHVGTDGRPGRETHGHARIVDPWGRILAERPQGPGIVYAELDFKELERVRRELPALKHRRL